jgi:hypothetical protein
VEPLRRWAARRLATLAALFALLATARAQAAGSNAEPWQTLTTEHFEVHFAERLAPLAPGVAEMAEQAWHLLTPWLGHAPPGRTHVVIDDSGDSANGFAFVVPRETMHVNAVPPELDGVLGHADNWMWNLIVHEFTHVVQIGTISGIPELANIPFGRRFAPNQNLPRWFLEGLATYAESVHTGTGRVHATLFRTMRDQAFVGGVAPTLGQLSGLPDHWPGATGWYLFGGFFVADIAERRGSDALAAYFADYGDDVLPYGVNRTAREHLGAGIDVMWSDWTRAAADEAQRRARLRAEAGLTPTRAVTRRGWNSRAVIALRSGLAAWIRSDAAGPARIEWFDATGAQNERIVDGVVDLAPGPGAEEVLASVVTPSWRGTSYRDLWRIDLRTGRHTRVTTDARLREPDLAPDGRRALAAAVRDGRTDLVEVDLASGHVRPICRGPAWSRFAMPTYLDDTSAIAVLQAEGDGTRLVRVDLSSGEVSPLTDGTDTVLDPHAVGDGSIIFVSDRTGAFEVHRLELSTGVTTRLTRTAGALFSPTVAKESGRWDNPFAFAPSLYPGGPSDADQGFLFASSYGPNGYDIVAMPWAPGSTVGDAPFERREQVPVIARVALPEPLDPDASRYGAWRLLTPATWGVYGSRQGGTLSTGAQVVGGDPGGRSAYALSAEWSPALGEAFGSLGVATSRFDLDLSANVFRNAYVRAGARIIGRRDQPFVEEAFGGSISTAISLPGLRTAQALGAVFEARWVDALDQRPPDFDPSDPPPRLPEFGPLHAVGLGYAWNRTRAYADSISTEQGAAVNVSTRLRGPWTGSFARTWELGAGVRGFVPMPWERQVLALRAFAGAGGSDFDRRTLYSLGGPDAQDPFVAWYAGLGASSAHVRGQPPAARSGDAFYLANLEYRFPIVRLDAGIDTLPLYLGRLSGALFADVGDARQQPGGFGTPMGGIGAELRLGTLIGYFAGASFRGGAAWGLGAPGGWDLYLLYGSAW